jgi:hypothetical protein
MGERWDGCPQQIDQSVKSASLAPEADSASGQAMNDAKDLREKAKQARRAASIRTESGQAADRQLRAMAVKLERQAEESEKQEAIFAKLRP